MTPRIDRPLRILQVNTFDSIGGAARIARSLFERYRARGHDAWLAVGHRALHDPHVVSLDPASDGGGLVNAVTKAVGHQLGIEDFGFPATRRLLDLPGRRPDVIHAHNLHGGYFDLRVVSELSDTLPMIVTLHDAWLLSGHCGHSLDCERWRTGCGHCPDLSLDPPVRRDATAFNWQRKRRIYARSRLHVAAPSRWLMAKVEQSMLAPAITEARIIPNGVDLEAFRPGDRAAARLTLGLPPDAAVVLFVAYAARTNRWKDYGTLRQAVALAAERVSARTAVLVVLGDAGTTERTDGVEVRFVPYESDPTVVAEYYRAADVYAHASVADTFPTTILEAMACGTPVVATAVGGVPEQVDDGREGFLVAVGDADAFAARLGTLLANEGLRSAMGRRAADRVRVAFDLERQVDAYLAWYEELVPRVRRRG